MPQRNQAKLNIWDQVKFYAGPIPGVEFNEAELLVRYPTGNKLQLFGADNPDALRGPGFSGLSFDEYSQHPSNLFSEVLSKSLADHLGYANLCRHDQRAGPVVSDAESRGRPAGVVLAMARRRPLAGDGGDATILVLRKALEGDLQLIADGLMTRADFDQEWYLSGGSGDQGRVVRRGDGRLEEGRTDHSRAARADAPCRHALGLGRR